MTGGKIDYLDMSLWEVFKQPMEEDRQEKSLLGWFTDHLGCPPAAGPSGT